MAKPKGKPQSTPPSKATPKRIGADLYEGFDVSEATVDRKNCVIKNVKILGKKSPNRHGMDVDGTDYLPSAHAQVRRLYEGRKVNVGHPPRNDPDADRQPRDRNGVLFNIITKDDQTYGNWKLIPSHPMTQIFMDCAADPQLHDQFALSHNAKGFGHVREGRYQVSEIPHVRSVDVVCDGGTNSSLYESREKKMSNTKKKPFKVILEAALQTTRDRFRPLLEMYEELGDMPADAPPPMPEAAPADDKPAMDYLGHLAEMVKAICSDEGLSTDEKKDKIMAAIKVMEETKGDSGGGDEGGAPPGGDEGGAPPGAEIAEGDEEDKTDEEKDKDKDALESKEREELKTLRGEKEIRTLCESREYQPTALQIKAMLPLSKTDRTAFIDEQKKLTSPPSRRNGTNGTKTSTGRTAPVRESAEPDFTDTSEEARKKRAAAWLK